MQDDFPQLIDLFWTKWTPTGVTKEEWLRDLEQLGLTLRGDVKRHPVYVDYGCDHDGNIWSFKIDKIRGRKMKPSKNRQGYLVLAMSRHGLKGQKTKTVHRLVCETFYGLSSGAWACHKNGNKLDNRPSNLYWGDRQKNMLDAIRLGEAPFGENGHQARLTEKKVIEIRDAVKNGISHKALAHSYGVHIQTIKSVTRRRSWKHVP